MRLSLQVGFFFVFCFLSSVGYSHESHLHGPPKQIVQKPDELLRAKQVNQEINKEYLNQVNVVPPI